MMGPTRFERVTSRLSAVRSTRLSYGPGPHLGLMIPLITVSLQRSLPNQFIIDSILSTALNPKYARNPIGYFYGRS